MAAEGSEHPLTGTTSDPVWDRLEDQLAYYDRQAGRSRLSFQTLKVFTLLLAAAIPLVAVADGSAVLAGVLGALIVVLEGVQQLFQYQQNWISYRGTAEALKREKFLYVGQAGAYATSPRPSRLLAERVEDLVTSEHAGWAATRREAAQDAVPPRRTEPGPTIGSDG